MIDDVRKKVAVFRYGIIADLVTESFKEASKEAFYKNASARIHKDQDGNPYKVSPSTIERWYIKYKRYGFNGLLPKQRKDEGQFRKVSNDVITWVEKMKSEFPRMPATSIYEKLIEEGLIRKKDLSLSSINRLVNMLDNKNNYKLRKEMRRYEKEHINELWVGDSSIGPYVKVSGKKIKTYIIALIDDASRMIVGIKIFENDNFVNLMSVIKSAISKYGKPKHFNFDNGKPYKNEQMSLLAARIGTVIRYCEPYSPEAKAKIERWFRTCKDHWMRVIDWNNFNSIDELEESLLSYVNRYNNTLHSSIGMTPIERFFSEPQHIKRLTEKKIKESFLLEKECRVSADNIIILDKRQYEVPYIYSKQRIKIRYAHDLSEVYVVKQSDELEKIDIVDKIANSKIKREKIKLSEVKS
ncbi:MAG: DDE-type integrase/transposase/recombinase [Bacilli bacterium]|nr:DDE-type integrase/transposase/recombinase [Bacilli bacterium]